jgi:urea transporter
MRYIPHKSSFSEWFSAVLNSYAVVFFSQNKVFGFLLLLVSFLNVNAGIAGLACVCFSLLLVSALGYQKESIRMGLYSFNSLLLGIGFGSFFHFNIYFWFWLTTACFLVVILTIIFTSLLGKYGLPVLTLPFIFTFWIVLLAVNGFAVMGLKQINSLLLNEMQNTKPESITDIINYFQSIKVPFYLDLFFRSLSAIFFQNSVFAGMLMCLGLFIHSRITLSLMVLGFVIACLFNSFTGTYLNGISYYHLGSNLMMVSTAIGGFFLIPSIRSYAWAIIAIPLTILIINALTKLLNIPDLPIFSMPFCIVTLALLYFFILRINAGKLALTPLQHYSPEVNLYQFLNGNERLQDFKYLKLSLPFMGSWVVSQGYDGDITHQGEWSKALDFVIKDELGHTFANAGSLCEHYYCFNKPVLACADGMIENVVDHIPDNGINMVNTTQNWGNSVVIKHAGGLYSKVSHLKQNSVKVTVGDFVKQGDLLGLCGNSGRSPEPHLHFQAQLAPYVGSKTYAYPFSYFVSKKADGVHQFNSFSVPEEGLILQAPVINNSIKQAFSFQPGYSTKIKLSTGEEETWEVFTDALNQTYIYSLNTQARAYFVNNGTVFYFTSFYGSRNSALYSFYQAAYKVIFSAETYVIAIDKFPLHLSSNKFMLYLHDFFAPFFLFIKRNYKSSSNYNQGAYSIESQETVQVLGKPKKVMSACIIIEENAIQGFTVNLERKEIKARWCSEN